MEFMATETTDTQKPVESQAGLFPIASLILAWILILGASFASYFPPAPAGIADKSFSALRAKPILEQLVGDGIPHPSGSEQNRIVRQRITDMLESWGYEVETQTGNHRTEDWRSGNGQNEPIELCNLIAIKRGKAPASESRALMLVSHYDSVAAGPGASDDGVGVAAMLEIAKMLANQPPRKRDIVFLITDGEEAGLLGAKLFVDKHPLARQIGLMVNVEARGTTGPSMMFETSHHSRRLIPLFAKSVDKPHTSSLFFEIYRRMPNDTDFSVLRKQGMLGFNFAFIGDVRNYHTPEDSFDNVDFGSLQHHGDNMLGIIQAAIADDSFLEFLDRLAGQQESGAIDGVNEAVYFDVFGLAVVWWPMNWTPAIVTVVALLSLLSMGICWICRNRDLEWQSVISLPSAIPILLLCFVIAGFSVWSILLLIQLDPDTASSWPRQPVPIAISLWLSSLAVVGWVSVFLHRVLTPVSTWCSVIAIGLILAALSCWFVPGASYLFIVPISLAVVGSFFISLTWRRVIWVHGWWLAVSVGLIWLPLDRLFYDAVGFGRWPLIVGKTAMVSTTIVVLLSASKQKTRSTFALVATFSTITALVAAVFMNLNS